MPENIEPYSMIEALSMMLRRYHATIALSNTDPQFVRSVIGDTRIAVGYHLSDQPAEPEHIRKFLEAALGSFYHYFVFVSNQPLSDRLRDYANAHEVILLDRQDLIKELGEAYLSQIETFTIPPIAQNHRENSLQRRQITEGVEESNEPELIRVLKRYRIKHAPEPQMPLLSETKVKSGENEIRISTEKTKPPEGVIIHPEIPVTQLGDIVPDIGRIKVAQMELIPYFLFSYTCRNVDEEKNPVGVGKGIVAVNGVTSDVEEWEAGFRTVTGLNMDYIRIVPRLNRKISWQLAYNGVIRLNSRVISVVIEKDGVMKKVKRKTAPEPDTIRLDFQGVFYFPHWHIEGEDGSVLIDAVNGEVISKKT